jgi:hypothetical protein
VTQDTPDVEDEPQAPAPPSRARRFRSHRRVPAAITAAVVLAVAGPLLYDIAAVRAGRSASAWRKRLADELATRPLDDPWIITGAAVAAVLGLWLIVLAVTPGLRPVLPLRRDTPAVRAGIDRHAAELLLRDRAMEVSGVRAARATVTRRRAVVRAEVHFGETERVSADLNRVVAEAVTALALDRPPAVKLRTRRTGTGGDHAG